jgi:HAMP domain-containing protein
MITQRSRPPLIPILVGFALLLVLLAYLAVRGLFRPIATIRAGAAYIGAGHFTHRIRTRREDELGELAGDINRMAGKVEGMLDAKRQLLLGVSHELRSPISRMTLGLALLEDSPAIGALQLDLKEMRSIVETLLEAERLDSPRREVQEGRLHLGLGKEAARRQLAQSVDAHHHRVEHREGAVGLASGRRQQTLRHLALQHHRPVDEHVAQIEKQPQGRTRNRIRKVAHQVHRPGKFARDRGEVGAQYVGVQEIHVRGQCILGAERAHQPRVDVEAPDASGTCREGAGEHPGAGADFDDGIAGFDSRVVHETRRPRVVDQEVLSEVLAREQPVSVEKGANVGAAHRAAGAAPGAASMGTRENALRARPWP